MENQQVTFDMPLATRSGIAKVTQGPRKQHKVRLVDNVYFNDLEHGKFPFWSIIALHVWNSDQTYQ